MKEISETVLAIFSLTKNEKDTASVNIEHYIKNHIGEVGAKQSNMAARREICTSTDVGNLISNQVAMHS